MISWPTLRSCDTDIVARRLHDLAEHFTACVNQVRRAVAEAIRETLAHRARATVDGLLKLRRLQA